MKKAESFHEDLGREETVKTSSDRAFGLTFAVFFSLVAALRAIEHHPNALGWLVAAAICAVLALFFPTVLAPLNRVWTAIAMLLFKLISPITLAILFFIVITPIGFLMRLVGKDPLRLKLERTATSYWIEREAAAPESMKNQF